MTDTTFKTGQKNETKFAPHLQRKFEARHTSKNATFVADKARSKSREWGRGQQ